MLQNNQVISISGNQDRIILESLNQESGIATLEYVKTMIDDNIIHWLGSLPFDMIYDEKIYACHASPHNDSAYLLESLVSGYVTVKKQHELDKELATIQPKIVVCGHSHVARIVKTTNALIHNVGSVGLPAYEDDLPIPHQMESFHPNAQYSILTLSNHPIQIEQVAVPYDYETAAQQAEKNARKDWAQWIRTGRTS